MGEEGKSAFLCLLKKLNFEIFWHQSALLTNCSKFGGTPVRYESDVRVAFVGYRDHCDGERFRLERLDFGPVDAFRSFLRSVEAKGGGDDCEDVLGGMAAAARLSWRRANRCLVHVADMPAHGRRFHRGYLTDDYGGDEAEPHGIRVEDVIGRLKRKGVDYCFCKITRDTDLMIRVFKEVGGEDFKMRQGRKEGRPNKFLDFLQTLVTSGSLNH